MEDRQLGKTPLNASVIGVGVEHLKNVSTENIRDLFRLALKNGVNYFDLVWSFSKIMEGLKEALRKQRADSIIAFHLGSCISSGEYIKSRNPSEREKQFRMQLEMLNLDSAPLLYIHYALNLKVWREINRKGIISLAERLKEAGVARTISVSTHQPEVVKPAAEPGVMAAVMHQVNILNHFHPAPNEALNACSRHGVGVVAMKPFAGGELLKAGQKVRIPAYKTGWKTMTVQVPWNTTSTRLLSYVLEQSAVCTAVIGVSSVEE